MPHLACPTSHDFDPFGGSADVGTQKSGAGTCTFEPETYAFELRRWDQKSITGRVMDPSAHANGTDLIGEIGGVASGLYLNSGHSKAEPYRHLLRQRRTALVA